MTKALSFAALFLASTFAATASLTSLTNGPAHESAALRRAAAQQRGTRAQLVTRTAAENTVGVQPRRGARAER